MLHSKKEVNSPNILQSHLTGIEIEVPRLSSRSGKCLQSHLTGIEIRIDGKAVEVDEQPSIAPYWN